MHGALRARRYVPGPKRQVLRCFRRRVGVRGTPLSETPGAQPNLNAFAERWVRSVKEECLAKLILFGENSLHRALAEFTAHFHSELNHPGKGNIVLFPIPKANCGVHCGEHLGLLRYWSRAA